MQQLIQLTCTPLSDLHAAGGLERMIAVNPIPAIEITPLDLEKLFGEGIRLESCETDRVWDYLISDVFGDTDGAQSDFAGVASHPPALRRFLATVIETAGRHEALDAYSKVDIINLVCEQLAERALANGDDGLVALVDSMHGLYDRIDPEA